MAYYISSAVQYGALKVKTMSGNVNLWPKETAAVTDSGWRDVCGTAFLARTEGECLTLARNYALDAHLLQVADTAASALTDPIIKGIFATEMMIQGKESLISIRVSTAVDDDDDLSSSILQYSIQVLGTRKIAQKVFTALDDKFGRKKYAQLLWWHQQDRGPQTRTFYLPPLTTSIHAEFYPDMGDPRQFLADYLKSDASILMMAGPPGTGKTTLLRHLICDHYLKAHIVYDEKLMDNDSVFQSFLFGDSDVMVIEDADKILSSREHDQNRLMSRFLNVSDGLIKLPNKKLIFTTNISDFGRVDPALLRPGRCYGVLHTRLLNLGEAQAAAKVAGLPVPLKRGEYTLAELFNNKENQPTVRQVGFGTGA